MKTRYLFLVLLFLISCTDQEDYLDDSPKAESLFDAPTFREDAPPREDPVPFHYIVTLRATAQAPSEIAGQLSENLGVGVRHIYTHALKGFALFVPPQAMTGLRNHPLIERIEPDYPVKAYAQTVPTGVRRIETPLNPVAKIDGNNDPMDVDIAIIDTGVDQEHPDLNIAGGVCLIENCSSWDDQNGHGTHVAGTAAAIDNDQGVVGVAPGARVWAVRVLDAYGSGFRSDVIAGIDWVTQNAATIEVVNMSLGGVGYSSIYHEAIRKSVAAGVVYVVAAGNSSEDIFGFDKNFGTDDDYIPAALPEVATIAAMADSDGLPGGQGPATGWGADDGFAGFSNYSRSATADNPVTSPGKGIDLLLPGVDIYSADINLAKYSSKSGTSMASPHAAGLAALYIAQNGRANNATGVYAIRQALIDGGIAQNHEKGLVELNDPDFQLEHIGWAGDPSPGDRLPPIAEAGPDQWVHDSDGDLVEYIILDGSGSSDPDGIITTYEWDINRDGEFDRSSSEPLATVLFPTGTHAVGLRVTDNDGLQAIDQLQVVISETASPDPLVKSVTPNVIEAGQQGAATIEGSNFDAGAAVTFENGSGTPPVTSALVVESASTIQVTISTINDGQASSVFWDVVVTNPDGTSGFLTDGLEVTPAGASPNQPPQADAGSDKSVTDTDGDGEEVVELNGSASSDPDGTIVSYEWDTDGDNVADKTGAVISDAVFPVGTTLVTLTVTDDGGLTGQSQINVTVEPAPTAPLTVTSLSPSVIAPGSSQTVTVSGTSFADGAALTLENGEGPAPDVSNIQFVDASTLTATIGIKSGGGSKARFWDVRVTNPGGASAVLPDGLEINPNGPSGPQAPTADAGPDQQLTDSDGNGEELANLDGSASSDPDGSISSYEWDVNGDGITDYTGMTVSNVPFPLGDHTVTLTVTDNEGLTAADQVLISVSDAAPPPPAEISISSITPNIGLIGASVDVTIQGSGFQSGAGISLTSGAGPAPEVLNINVQDGSTITATISIPTGGPQKDRRWTVVVTNPDGSSASLVDGFTVSVQTGSQGTDTKLKGMD